MKKREIGLVVVAGVLFLVTIGFGVYAIKLNSSVKDLNKKVESLQVQKVVPNVNNNPSTLLPAAKNTAPTNNQNNNVSQTNVDTVGLDALLDQITSGTGISFSKSLTVQFDWLLGDGSKKTLMGRNITARGVTMVKYDALIRHMMGAKYGDANGMAFDENLNNAAVGVQGMSQGYDLFGSQNVCIVNVTYAHPVPDKGDSINPYADSMEITCGANK